MARRRRNRNAPQNGQQDDFSRACRASLNTQMLDQQRRASSAASAEDDFSRACRNSLFSQLQDEELNAGLAASQALFDEDSSDMLRAIKASRASADEEEALQQALALSLLDVAATPERSVEGAEHAVLQEAMAMSLLDVDVTPGRNAERTALSSGEDALALTDEAVLQGGQKGADALGAQGPDLLQIAEDRAAEIMATGMAVDWFELGNDDWIMADVNDSVGAQISTPLEGPDGPAEFNIATPPATPRRLVMDDWEIVGEK